MTNGIMAKIDTLYMTKTDENLHLLGSHIPISYSPCNCERVPHRAKINIECYYIDLKNLQAIQKPVLEEKIGS